MRGMENTTITLEPGDIVQVKVWIRGARTRTLTVRVKPGQQCRNTGASEEYLTFPGIRVRPDETNVSFGLTHYYTARVSHITKIAKA